MNERSVTAEDRLETLKLLTQYGAELNEVNSKSKGNNLFHLFGLILRALKENEVPAPYKQILKILIKNINSNALKEKNLSGKTPLDVTKRFEPLF